MGKGIIVCGLNGTGKSTLGRDLAEKLGVRFLDNEELYFPKTDPDNPYASARTREEAKQLLLSRINQRESFVFAAVKGDYGEEIDALFGYAVWITVPKEIRMQRVRNRSFEQFGARMLPGGDLYERETRFFDMVNAREEHMVETWTGLLSCPVIQVDGTKPVGENVDFIISQITGENGGQLAETAAGSGRFPTSMSLS